MLIKFDPGAVGDSNVGFFLRHESGVDAKVVGKLPLIPDAYAIRFEGDVPSGIEELVNKDRQFHEHPWIEWAQPDYVTNIKLNASPNQAAYWPNDPLYWFRKWSNPNACTGPQGNMGQVGSWPLNYDLRDPNAVWSTIDPTPEDLRDTSVTSVLYPRPASSSIDVLPVWNALGHLTRGRTGNGPHGPIWSTADLQRSGIAIWDTGISNNPDLTSQVAAVISAGQERGSPDAFPDQSMTLAYADGFRPADRQALESLGGKTAGIETTTNKVRSNLFPLDDTGSLKDSPAPTGCDGHGTEVASVAAATANNGQGVAGVGWNVPIVAIRPWRSWDDGKARTVADALTLQSYSSVDVTDETLVDQLAAAKALGVPVVNMSFGGQLFESKKFTIGEGLDRRESTKTVVTHPAVVEAFAHAFSGDTMLGVASAGDRPRYGSGRDASGAVLTAGAADAAQAPCGLRTLAADLDYVQLAGRASPFPVSRDVLRNLDLICVACDPRHAVGARARAAVLATRPSTSPHPGSRCPSRSGPPTEGSR